MMHERRVLQMSDFPDPFFFFFFSRFLPVLARQGETPVKITKRHGQRHGTSRRSAHGNDRRFSPPRVSQQG